jgi:hypothetical protein
MAPKKSWVRRHPYLTVLAVAGAAYGAYYYYNQMEGMLSCCTISMEKAVV